MTRAELTAPADTGAWVRQGLRLRVADPRALVEFAARMRSASPQAAGHAAYADVLEAIGVLAAGERGDEVERLHARARAAFESLDDAAGIAIARGVAADLGARDGRWDAILQAADHALALPIGVLPDEERCRAASRRANALELLGRYDDALRAHHASVAMARATAQPTLLANALGALGGLQSSLMNLEDAAPPCDEAWSLCARTDWHGVVQLVGHNRMSVLSGLQRHEEALALAHDLAAREPWFPQRHRISRLCLRAMVHARAGQLAQAQSDLDAALRQSHGGMIERAEWVWIQARVHNRCGRASEAVALIEPYLERHHAELKGSEYPVDRAELYAEAALAHEALGRLREALVFERQAADAREQAAAQAAHARRLTLQITHELDAAHRARDEALRESEQARRQGARLAALNRELEAANAAKTRFLAAASHDLRQPVQALAMYVAALQREPSARERQALVVRIDASLQSLAHLFDALLDISQLDAGAVPVQPAPLQLDAMLCRLVDEYRLAAAARGLVLRLRLPPRLRTAGARSDAALLERCLRNLLDNALKYTARGGCIVRLRALPGERWRVELRDTGIGIDAHAQQQVFDEFFQIGNDARDRTRGLGLGLAIVRRSAALLGHPLGLRSRPGRGSCFWIELPRVAWVEETGWSLGGADTSASLALIVIDDDAQVRDALVALLQRWGHQALAGDDAETSLAAWRHLGCPPVHGAIVDLRLRDGRTGLQAIADLRAALDARLPALVVTGDIAPERLNLLAAAGQPWLPKPLMPMRLRSWLQRLPATGGERRASSVRAV